MLNSNILWTIQNLDQFITDPRGFLSGTSMTFLGNSNQQERLDVIAYLQTFEPTPTNTAPQAIDDSYGVSSRNTLTISATAGVLSNDLDADGDSLTAVLVSTSTGALAL